MRWIVLVWFTLSAPALAATGDSTRTGKFFRVICHFESEDIVNEALRTAEMVWPEATNLLGVDQGAHAAKMTLDALKEKASGLPVHNVNFPINTKGDTPVERTEPGIFHTGSLFEKTADASYEFAYTDKHKRIKQGDNTDEACLKRGNISRTLLDYSVLGARQ